MEKGRKEGQDWKVRKEGGFGLMLTLKRNPGESCRRSAYSKRISGS